MKKLNKAFVACVAALIMVLALGAPAFAEAQLDNVTDAAYLLTDAQRQTLEQTAEGISAQYECGAYIIILDDYTEYVNAYDVEDAAKALYEGYTLGVGAENSGILLLLSMAERDYALVAYGYGNTAFTDYGKEVLSEEFLDNFAKDDWNGGFTDYLTQSATMLASARAGKPLDVGSDPKTGFFGLLISLALAAVLAGGICLFLRQTMRSVATGAEADSYIPAESVAFTCREDRFTHTTVVRTKIEKKSSGGTTVDSSGFSGKSGKF